MLLLLTQFQYIGAKKKVNKYFNPKRFINYDLFISNDSLINYIDNILSEDDLAYSIISQSVFVDDKIPSELDDKNVINYFTHIFNVSNRLSSFHIRVKKIKYIIAYNFHTLP